MAGTCSSAGCNSGVIQENQPMQSVEQTEEITLMGKKSMVGVKIGGR